jgi:hypothetical protein
MSKLVLSGDTSGSVTLDAPAVSGTTTLTLPTTSGTLIYSDASANLQFNSGYGSVATAYGCRAWVNFNGTGTVAIRASGGVSSITDRGNGQYTANFTTTMPDANYSFSGLCANTGSGKAVVTEISLGSTGALFNTAPGLAGAALEDSSVIVISVFR